MSCFLVVEHAFILFTTFIIYALHTSTATETYNYAIVVMLSTGVRIESIPHKTCFAMQQLISRCILCAKWYLIGETLNVSNSSTTWTRWLSYQYHYCRRLHSDLAPYAKVFDLYIVLYLLFFVYLLTVLSLTISKFCFVY